MATRIHIVAAMNMAPEDFAAAFDDLGKPDVKQDGPWTWFAASVWGVDSAKLMAHIEALPVPALHVKSEDACRWYLHLRGPDQPPYNLCHEFTRLDDLSGEGDYDSEDDDEDEEDEVDFGVVEFSFPVITNVTGDQAQMIGDDFFNVDDYDEVNGEEEPDPEPQTPIQQCIADYAFMGHPLPPDLVKEIEHLPYAKAMLRLYESQANDTIDALKRVGIAINEDEVRSTLLCTNVTDAEFDSDLGNMYRFLVNIGFKGEIEEALNNLLAMNDSEYDMEDDYEDVNVVLGVMERMRHYAPVAIDRGPLPIDYSALRSLFFIASYTMSHVEAAIIVEGPGVNAVDPAEYLSREVADWWSTDDAWHFWTAMHPTTKDAARLAKFLEALPDESAFTIIFSPHESGIFDIADYDEGAGLQEVEQCYAGKLRAGRLYIEQSYPQLPREALDQALAFIEATQPFMSGDRKTEPLQADSEEELQAILEAAQNSTLFYNQPPRPDGLKLAAAPGMKDELRCLLFRQRFRQWWDTTAIEEFEARNAGELKQIEKELEEAIMPPNTGRVVYEGDTICFLEAKLDELSSKDRRRLAKTDEEMKKIGYEPLGNLCSLDMAIIILRAYGHATGEAYAILYLNVPYLDGREFYTAFTEGASVTTTTLDGFASNNRAGIFFRSSAKKNMAGLYAEHRKGIEKLKAAGLTPEFAEPKLEAAAQAVELFNIRKQAADAM